MGIFTLAMDRFLTRARRPRDFFTNVPCPEGTLPEQWQAMGSNHENFSHLGLRLVTLCAMRYALCYFLNEKGEDDVTFFPGQK